MLGKVLFSAAAIIGVAALLGRDSEARSVETTNRLFTDQFDPVFRRRCPSIPLPFLRALAKHESDFDPSDTDGPAHGLLQITEKVRKDFNSRFGTSHPRSHLLDPDVNVEIACELIARIAKALPANHPRAIPNPSWRDPRFVGLVTLAWNAGFSEAAGMGFVLGQMEAAGISPQDINIDSVREFSLLIPDDKAKFLRLPIRVEFARKVVRDYMAQIVQV